MPIAHAMLDLCSLGVLGDPLLSDLLKCLRVRLVLVGNAGFDRVIGLGSNEDLANEGEDLSDAVWRLPRVATEDTQAHGPLFVICDIGMVDLGPEGDDWRLEWVFLGQCHFELELSALQICQSCFEEEKLR